MNSSEIVAINSMASSMPRLPVKVDGRSLISHMKNHPFYGFVDVSLPGGGSFIMINLNDCAVSSKIFWTGQFAYEPGSLSVWRHLSKTSGSIVDCGAYTGIYSLVSAAVNNASMIYAFEPVSFIRARLSKNAIINKFSKIKVFPTVSGCDSSRSRQACP